jgi:hypothetical protein
VAFSPGDDFVNSVPAAAVYNSSASATVDDPGSKVGTNAYVGCTAISSTAPPSSCSQSTYTYVHGDFAPETNDTWAGFVGPGVLHLGADNAVWTDHTDILTTLLDLVGLHEPYTPDGRVITQIIDPTFAGSENTAALRSTDATTLGLDLKKLNAPVYMSAEGANDGFGPATLVADTAALASGTSSSDPLYSTVEGDIGTITAERNYVVSDIQAQLLAAELNGTATNGATDEADTTCILTYANTLKAYAQSGGTTAAPTDCNIGPPAATPEVPFTPLLILAGGLVLAGAVFFTGRRQRAVIA